MLNEVPIQQPDLWAECIKNLVSVGSALIVTAYVALAQFSHQSGQLSALQSKAFFKYIFPPRESASGFLLLIVACALTTDNAGFWMKSISLTAFFGAGILHGKNLKLMYTWSAGSQVSHAFLGQETRPYYVRKWLTDDNSTSSDEKAVLILQHFENAGKAASGADKKYAITLFQKTTLQLLSQYVQVAKSEGAIDKKLEGLAERLRWMLHYSRLMYGLSSEAIDVWYNPKFLNDLAGQVRQLDDTGCSAVWAVRDHLIWLNRQIGEVDEVKSLYYRIFLDALLVEVEQDYPLGLKSYLDSRSLMSMGVMMSVIDASSALGPNVKVPSLAKALDYKHSTVYAFFIRSCFVDHTREAYKLGSLSVDSAVSVIFRTYLEDVSMNHVLRLIQLERDVCNAHSASFIDAIAKTNSGDGTMMLTNPPDDPRVEIERIGRGRREAAEYFFLPHSQHVRVQDWLDDMKIELEGVMAAAKDDTAQATADAALAFLNEHMAFLEARKRERESVG